MSDMPLVSWVDLSGLLRHRRWRPRGVNYICLELSAEGIIVIQTGVCYL